MTYLHLLVAISADFLLLERLFPWRASQPLRRPGLVSDLTWLAVNGHLFSVLTAGLTAWTVATVSVPLRGLGLLPGAALASAWPIGQQLIALLVVSDFLQWCVHNLLHRVPWLWTFHKVHHSVTTMDFLGNFRFHWMEIVIYRAAQWLPLAWLGASPPVAMTVAVLGTVWGDLNHSNLNVGLGPLGHVFNSPRMHLWHHDVSSEGGTAKNFGIVLSLWDFVFGTAYWPPDRSPERLGYPGMEEMPGSFLGQVVWPISRRRPRSAP
jgi:sterol desaturase/sphingolipid hydroxylase (fatty acid hydroxylase superfamily)